MSELDKVDEQRSMGVPRSGGSSSSSSSNNSSSSSSSCCGVDGDTSKDNKQRGEKRPWTDPDSSSLEPPSKLVCTSPPHGLCAEDVPQQQQPLHGSFSAEHHEEEEEEEAVLSAARDTERLMRLTVSDDSDRDTEDDEEDKDSGFIDSNSIDSSSDDDLDVRISASVAVVTVTSGSCGDDGGGERLSCGSPSVVTHSLNKLSICTVSSSIVSTETSLLYSAPMESVLTKSSSSALLPSCSSAFSTYSSLSAALPPCVVSDSELISTTPLPSFSRPEDVCEDLSLSLDLISSSGALSYISQPLRCSLSSDAVTCSSTVSSPVRDGALCVQAFNNTSMADTTVTSAYSGTVSTVAYDSAQYQPYSVEFQARSVVHNNNSNSNNNNSNWSCNFYDGSQPSHTNKYMEIQTSRGCASASGQAIQCDANGKSYIELGSSSYSQPFIADCTNYLPSTTNNYSSPLYSNNQSFNTPNGYHSSPPSPQPNHFYRPNYPPYNNYTNGESYPGGFDNEAGCNYGYSSTYSRPAKLSPPRCGSPYCDPVKPSPRSPCYQQQRINVFNISVYKLNRLSRMNDSSLHKSVLIYNTVRLIEKQWESEGMSMNAIISQQHMSSVAPPPHPPPTPPLPVASQEGPLPPILPPIMSSPCSPPPILSPPVMMPYNSPSSPYCGYPEQPYDDLRSTSTPPPPTPASVGSGDVIDGSTPEVLEPSSPLRLALSTPIVAQPVPSSMVYSGLATSPTNNSGGEERVEGSINWCSVLSLSSHSDLDSLNNNEYCEWSSDTSMEVEYSSSITGSTNSSLLCVSSGTSADSSPSEEDPGSSLPGQWRLPSLSADDVLKSFPDQCRRASEDNVMSGLAES